MSSSTPALSDAEAYAQWGERIRCLFAAPPSFLDTTVAHSPFERHTCAVPFSPALTHGEPAIDPATREAEGSYDASLYAQCFYARLLQSNGGAASRADGAVRQHTHQLHVDEDALAQRLAARLRTRHREDVARLRREREVASGSLVSPFCDPKVEEQQARLHSELTEFLLAVRAENNASAELRRQLLRSRVVRDRWHDAGKSSAGELNEEGS